MTAGFEISQLKGTPLYALAKNANVYGGKTLSKTEWVFFEQQCNQMGFSPEKYGLEIASEDIEGENFKETKKNLEKLTDSINDAYKSQFGRKNNAVETAKSAETKAYAIINTAKEGFVSSHGDNSGFIPENLGQRPNFMAPEYKDNLTKYVSDLNGWAQKVSEQYRNAESKTNEELAKMIMTNSDSNAAINATITQEVGDEIMANDNKNAKDINANVDREGAATRRAVHNEGAATRRAVHNEGAATRRAVHQEGAATRATVINEGIMTRNTVRREGEKISQAVHEEAAEIKNTVKEEGTATRKEVRKNAKETQELEGYSSKVSDAVTNRYKTHTTETVNKVNTMKNAILSSDLPHERKKELLDDLANFSDQLILGDGELEQKRREIEAEINSYSPVEEKPVYPTDEEPFYPTDEKPLPSETLPKPDIPSIIKNKPGIVDKIVNPKKTIEEQKPDIQDKTILDMPKKDDTFDKFKK